MAEAVAVSILMFANRTTAQTLTTLHTFTNTPKLEGEPASSLVISSNFLYGSTFEFATISPYTVFTINTDGSSFNTLYVSDPLSRVGLSLQTCGNLILSGNMLYGTVPADYQYRQGTVFALNTSGAGFQVLHAFTGSDGMFPDGLVLSNNILYGTTFLGGTGTGVVGTIFALNTDGTGFTNLFSFNLDTGGQPNGNLVLSGDTLYGTAEKGGSNGFGSIFSIKTDGSGFTPLHIFSQPEEDTAGVFTNCDGDLPQAGLTLCGDTLYGTATRGGLYGDGTIFSVHTDGTCFTTLYNFSGGSDGAAPEDSLILSSNTLYGTAAAAGLYGKGTVFSLSLNDTNFAALYSFIGGYDGANPAGGLVLFSNTLYGTTSAGGGGYGGIGTIFSLTQLQPPAPVLTMTLSSSNAILTWPGTANGFVLQSATNLSPPIAWSDVPAWVQLVNGGNLVTNPIGSTPIYFRLALQQ